MSVILEHKKFIYVRYISNSCDQLYISYKSFNIAYRIYSYLSPWGLYTKWD